MERKANTIHRSSSSRTTKNVSCRACLLVIIAWRSIRVLQLTLLVLRVNSTAKTIDDVLDTTTVCSTEPDDGDMSNDDLRVTVVIALQRLFDGRVSEDGLIGKDAVDAESRCVVGFHTWTDLVGWIACVNGMSPLLCVWWVIG